uniref:Uncharacterized protein n=1 Tax=Panagrolaimus sp. ES5 TaxID=591445 RepID=A0AC34FHQ9_9BILA
MSKDNMTVIFSNRSAAYLKLMSQKNALRKSKKDAEKAIELSPFWWKGHYRLAAYYIELEKWVEAKLCLDKSLNLNKNSAVVQALKVVENGLLQNSLTYQQRRKLYEITQEFGKLNLNYSIFSDDSEVKRSPSEVDEEWYDPHAGMYESSDNNVSLVSDNPNTSLNAEQDVSVLESSIDSAPPDSTESPPSGFSPIVEKSLSSRDLLLISLGLDQRYNRLIKN